MQAKVNLVIIIRCRNQQNRPLTFYKSVGPSTKSSSLQLQHKGGKKEKKEKKKKENLTQIYYTIIKLGFYMVNSNYTSASVKVPVLPHKKIKGKIKKKRTNSKQELL